MSEWKPGLPVVTPQDRTAWEVWRKANKLESQRARRATNPRIDYYPSKEALAVIHANAEWNTPVSTIIDRLIIGSIQK